MRISDWSSDVCSSDLAVLDDLRQALPSSTALVCLTPDEILAGADLSSFDTVILVNDPLPGWYDRRDRKSVVSGKSVSVSVDLGGRRIIKKNIHTQTAETKKTAQE